MGGSTSSQNLNQVDLSSATSIIVDNIMNCRGNSTVTQTLNLSGSYIEITDTKQVQAYKLDTQCAQKLETSADLQKKVSEAISSSAEAKSPGILGALNNTGSNVRSIINQQIKDYFENKNITNIVTTVNAQQGIDASGHHIIIKNFTQQQTTELLQKSIQDSLAKIQIVQDINNSLNSATSATTTNPISDIIDSVFGGLKNIWIILGVCGIIALIIAALFFREPIAAFFGVHSNQDTRNPNFIPPYQYMAKPAFLAAAAMSTANQTPSAQNVVYPSQPATLYNPNGQQRQPIQQPATLYNPNDQQRQPIQQPATLYNPNGQQRQPIQQPYPQYNNTIESIKNAINSNNSIKNAITNFSKTANVGQIINTLSQYGIKADPDMVKKVLRELNIPMQTSITSTADYSQQVNQPQANTIQGQQNNSTSATIAQLPSNTLGEDEKNINETQIGENPEEPGRHR